jgi:hypothetical protein
MSEQPWHCCYHAHVLLTARTLCPHSDMAQEKQHTVFFHPDLGIGGAERLVVDAAVALQERGHKVTIFTSHCDPQHCFDEARNGKPPAAPDDHHAAAYAWTRQLRPDAGEKEPSMCACAAIP